MLAYFAGDEGWRGGVGGVLDEQGANRYGFGVVEAGGINDAVEVGDVLRCGCAREGLGESTARGLEDGWEGGQIEGALRKRSRRGSGEARPAQSDGIRAGRGGCASGESGDMNRDGLTRPHGRGVGGA